MTPLESNIETVKTAAQECEKQLSTQLIGDADKLIETASKMQRYINTTNLLLQMKSVIEPEQIIKTNGLVKAL